jgi:small subunit ribosomal protein S6
VNKYEAMFVLDNSKVKPEPSECVALVDEILKKHDAKNARVERWDERKLAYEIKGQKRGTYILAHFEMDPAKPSGLRHDLSLNENFLRAMVFAVGEEFAPFMTAAEYEALRPKKEEEPPADEGRRRRRDDDGMSEDDQS